MCFSLDAQIAICDFFASFTPTKSRPSVNGCPDPFTLGNTTDQNIRPESQRHDAAAPKDFFQAPT